MAYFVEDETAGDVPSFAVYSDRPGDVPPILALTEAEAHIIAFALNAVAEGKHLVGLPNSIGRNSEYIHVYEGPTEGVAS